MHRLIVFCVLLATAAVGAQDDFVHRWVTSSQLLAPWQPTATDSDEALPTAVVNTAWSKVLDDTTHVVYFVETKQELFVSGEVAASILKSWPVMNISTPVTSTSAPTTKTSAATISTSEPTTKTRAATTSINAPTTKISAATTSTSAPTTKISAMTTSASAPVTAPPGYTYSSETRSFYKYHTEELYWTEANATCASEGAYLVILNDAVEAAVVGKMVRAANKWWTWTGVMDKRTGGVSDWRSIHGEPISQLYHNWLKYRPLDEGNYIYAPMHAEDLELIDHGDEAWLEFTCEISQ